jgi:hypothetical protein
MLNGDIEAILIFLRNTSFGPEYNITAVDPTNREKGLKLKFFWIV